MPRAPRRHPQERTVRDIALGYPESHEDFPWGHRAIKVRRKARSGWVTATFGPAEKAPIDAVRSWIDESFRAVAPKRLVATLGPTAKQRPPPRRPRSRSRRSG
jgi:hypothetical protein